MTTPHLTPRGPFTSPDGVAPFDIARRGYDRDQVDARLRELGNQLAAATKAHQEAEQRARTVDEEVRALRARDADTPMSQDSFGFRAEKILRMAEHEAADVRGRAAKEATTVIEQARADAEKHRHEVEQKLITRSAQIDQEAAQRNVAIQEREQQAQALLADARSESARIGEDAQRNADKLQADAEARSAQLQKRTDHECRRRHEAAEQELRRLGSLHDGVRGELARLHAMLGAEITGDGRNAPKLVEQRGQVREPAAPARAPEHSTT